MTDSNRLNECDFYPCKYQTFDEKTKKKQENRFISGSSIEIIGITNILKFIFITCQLSSVKYLPGLIFKDHQGNLLLEKISKQQLVIGFSTAFNAFLQRKHDVYNDRSKKKNMLDFIDYPKILTYLRESMTQMASLTNNDKIIDQKQTIQFFDNNIIKKLDQESRKMFTNFKNIFSTIFKMEEHISQSSHETKYKLCS